MIAAKGTHHPRIVSAVVSALWGKYIPGVEMVASWARRISAAIRNKETMDH